MGHITAARQVLRNGYLSWQWPDGNWEQELFFGTTPEFKDMGKFASSFGILRAWVDASSRPSRKIMLSQRATFPRQVLVKLSREFGEDNDLAGDASKIRGDRLRDAIKQVRK
jgi:hypothetical protein